MKHHEAAGLPYARALLAAGHQLVDGPADVFLSDLDYPGPHYRPVIDRHLAHGAKAFTYPHGANVPAAYDGIVEPYERMSGAFVVAPGHAEMVRSFGYPHAIHVAGWAYCAQGPFRACEQPRRVLFAPEHPVRGHLDDQDTALNRSVFEALLAVPGIALVVRHLDELERNGLWHVPGVTFVRGLPDGSVADIDAADVVVATGTYASLSVARGAPTVFFGQDRRPLDYLDGVAYVARTWERWRDRVRFPIDMADGPAEELLRAAARPDPRVADWRRRFIGDPLLPERFGRTLEWALAVARRPETRGFAVVADAQEIAATPDLLGAYARSFGPDDDATLVLLSPGEDTGAVVAALEGAFTAAGLADATLPDLVLVTDELCELSEAAIADGAHAALSARPLPGAFAGLPRHDAATAAALRDRAERQRAA